MTTDHTKTRRREGRKVLAALIAALLMIFSLAAAAAAADSPQRGAPAADPTGQWPTQFTLPSQTLLPTVDEKPSSSTTPEPTATSTPKPETSDPEESTSSSSSSSSAAPSSTPSGSSSDREESAADDPETGKGQTSVWLEWMNSKDSYDATPTKYDLRVSQGGMTDPIKKLGAFLLAQFWDVYRVVTSLMVWAFQFVLEFKFIDIVKEPAHEVAVVIEDVTNQIPIVAALATLSALMSGLWIMKGRSGAGFGEMAITAIIVTLLGMAFTKPVTFITGENGLLTSAQEAGSSITADLLYPKGESQDTQPVDPNDPNSPEHGGDRVDSRPEINDPKAAAQDAMTSRMLDTYIRTPHQLLNFGLFIDEQKRGATETQSVTRNGADTSDSNRTNPKCFNAYNKAFVEGDTVEPMKSESTCPKVVKDTMEHPDRSLVGAWMIAWAVFWTALFGIILLVGSSFLIGLAAWEAAKFGLALLKSLLPESSRDAIFASAATALIAAAYAGASIVLVGIYLLTLNAIFNATSGLNPVLVYIFIDIAAIGFCIGAVIMFIRARKQGRQFGRRAAQALSPKNVAKAMPTGRNLGQTAAGAAGRLAQTRAITRAAGQSVEGGQAGKGINPPPATLGQGGQKSMTRKALKGTGIAAKTAMAYTVGAPVTAPKAAAATKSALKRTKNKWVAQKAATTGKVAAAVADKKDGVSAYWSEYKNNTKAGLGHVRRVTPTGREKFNQHKQRQTISAGSSDAQRLNQLRDRLGRQVPPKDRMRASSIDTRFIQSAADRPWTTRQNARQAHGDDFRKRLAQMGTANSHPKAAPMPAGKK